MTLYIASLNSGSNGNCYYIGNDREAVLVDAGIPCRETEKRMRRLGLSMSAVKGIFISHEHDDHIRGLEVLSRRYQLPVFITAPTLQNSRLSLEAHLVRPFLPHEPVTNGGLSVTAFPKSHDASDPYSFVVSSPTVRVGIFTDLGVVCEQLIHHFRQCHAAFLESNYDELMLEQGRYPAFLKNRIRGGLGHLSNRQAVELFVRHRPSYMSHLFPAHLSRDNNRPELVQALFEQDANGTKIVIASRDRETELYAIDGLYSGTQTIPATFPSTMKKRKALTGKISGPPPITQGSLF
ncbi:MAG TPA: MBL fold metallo-hydrolase [Puia sp.]|jgi:phosphoribosyl 1,2-cyclic phosphodiesterase|nr:MBL fold metallo-hydrolase [Puia sp.]